MAVREVLICGDPVLRKKVAPCNVKDPDLPALVRDMFDTMYDYRGVGLAAPQIGLSVALFVMNASWSDGKEEDETAEAGTEEVFINPKILKTYGKEEEKEEGCLSVPEIHEKVKRKNTLDIEYTDLNGERQTEIGVTGLRARVIQHENDHLLGMLFIDRLSPTKKLFVNKELQRILEEAE